MLKRESALEIYNNHESSLHSGIKIQELQFSTKINLRGDLNDINFLSSIKIQKMSQKLDHNYYVNNGYCILNLLNNADKIDGLRFAVDPKHLKKSLQIINIVKKKI